MNIFKLDFNVAFVDIETYSLKQNAVVDEVGVLVTNFLPITDAPWSSVEMAAWVEANPGLWNSKRDDAFVYRSLSLRLEIIEQILAGRHVESDTVKFRREQHDKAAELFPELVRRYQYEEYANHSRYIVKDAVSELNQFFLPLGKIEEVWMNHPQFDSTRISNLLGNGYSVPWWTYRAERDLATMKAEARNLAVVLGMSDPYLIPEQCTKPRLEHVGIEDCFYNMWVVMKTRVFYKEIQRLTQRSHGDDVDRD